MIIDPLMFLRRIEALSASDILREVQTPSALLMDADVSRQGKLEVAYAPFDHVNAQAKVVIVGITPGRTQMEAALNAARSGFLMKLPEEEILERAKVHASFSGDMRKELVGLLDFIGLPKAIGISSAADLWGKASSLAHFTSALRYPTFFKGENYNGTPRVASNAMLKKHADTWFGEEARMLREAVFVLLGRKVDDAVLPVLRANGVPDSRIISNFFHPSPANRERVQYFTGTLGKEPSNRVNRARTDADREEIIAKVAAFR
ncbi:hypothetical protein OIU34_22370 [Pararhizobium sp. BT-229]|uniref:uracil-DNA glycosylase family protein n=1 Tax=Pararhizobium sp. BT-229 TaxID=2986923 RepID=UPI0021F7A5E2|nr:uracil-DNA glycosylase family protein [Pararhizobium sp. BT-229]MCV9964640.1 hypothetical protein [Pararhizobium sp. BT-229]